MRKLYHVFLCTVLLPVLGMLILCGLLSNFLQSLYLLSISVFIIFVAYYFACSAWFCAATISHSVSAFRLLLLVVVVVVVVLVVEVVEVAV